MRGLQQELSHYPPLGVIDFSSSTFHTELPTLATLEKHEDAKDALVEKLAPVEATQSAILQHDKHASTFRSSSPSTSPSAGPPNSTLKLWKRRLITRQDWKHTHKITGVAFLLSSWGLTAYAVQDLLANGWTQPVTQHGKPFLSLLLTLLASCVLQSFSSIRMACHYRHGKPAVRNTFLSNAAVAILGSGSALWSSPWYPASLNGRPSMAFYLIMDALGLIGMTDNLVRLKDLMASRQETRNEPLSGWQYWKDVFVYMMPILIGAPFFVAIGWQFGIQHDRSFYLNLLSTHQYPHLQAGAVYGMAMVAMGASYSSLIVTLRDKKLIRKRTEGFFLTVVLLALVGSLYQAMKDPGTIKALLGM